jgi:hypothetical protein
MKVDDVVRYYHLMESRQLCQILLSLGKGKNQNQMESRQLCQILLSLGKGKNQNQMESRQLLSDIIISRKR